MRRQLELISIQHENCEVYPNILKSQDVSARSPCAPVAGQRLNKSESCVGSALHLGFERGFPSSTDAKPTGSHRKTKFSSEPLAGWSLCRSGCAAERFVLCWERFPTQAGKL